MLPDLESVFAECAKIRAEADGLFAHMAALYPRETRCHEGCSDCCHALFDLSLVEAMSLNRAFARTVPHGPLRSRVLTRAGEIDRKLTRLKREFYQAEKQGEQAETIMARAGRERAACPLLEDGKCLLYEDRPITCRLYGIPLDIGGQSHVCGYSGYDAGKSYPTARLGKIQARLDDLSRQIGELIGSKYELAEVYTPLSMALLTNYDEAWFGLVKNPDD